jgi:hypothetical protein
MEMVGVGIQFMGMDDAAQGALDAWVDASVASEQN